MKPGAAGSPVSALRRATVAALALAAVAWAGCASTGRIAPRTLTVEVSTDPSSVLNLNIFILPIRGGGSPAGDPIALGTVRARDLASFEFDTDRVGRYELYATSGSVTLVANAVRISVGGRDDERSRSFYVDADTERIIWDIATNVVLVR